MGKQLVIPGANFSSVAVGPAKVLDSIAVTQAPTKITYRRGELFDPTGMVVTATFTDQTTSTQIAYTYSPYQFTTTGTVSVTISYTKGAVTATATQSVTVTAS